MAGIQDCEEVLAVFNALSTAILKSTQTGPIGIFDLPKFVPVIVAARKALRDAGGVPKELSGLSPEDMGALLSDVIAAGMNLVAAIEHAVSIYAPAAVESAPAAV